MRPLSPRFRKRLLWASALTVLVLVFVAIEWGAKVAALRAQDTDADRQIRGWELLGKMRIYGSHRHNLEAAINRGQPLPAIQIDQPYPVERVRFDGSLIDSRYTGWTVRFDFFLSRASGSDLRITPPPEPRSGIWAILGDPTFQYGAALVRQIVLVIAGATWLLLAILVPFSGAHRSRLALAMIAAGLTALLAWIIGPSPAGLWSIPPFNAIPAAAVSGFLLGVIVRMAPARGVPAGLNHCSACGYDLTANVSGFCPECGQPTPTELRRRRDAELAPLADAIEHPGMEPAEDLDAVTDPTE